MLSDHFCLQRSSQKKTWDIRKSVSWLSDGSNALTKAFSLFVCDTAFVTT